MQQGCRRLSGLLLLVPSLSRGETLVVLRLFARGPKGPVIPSCEAGALRLMRRFTSVASGVVGGAQREVPRPGLGGHMSPLERGEMPSVRCLGALARHLTERREVPSLNYGERGEAPQREVPRPGQRGGSSGEGEMPLE